MGGKKKGKKKSSATSSLKAAPAKSKGTDGGESTTKNATNTVCRENRVTNVSPLLFNSVTSASNDKLPFDIPYSGPIELYEKVTCDDDGNTDKSQQTPLSAVTHGRGLITTRDVEAGECLFICPAVASAPLNEVRRRFYLHDDGNGDGSTLEKITEEVLVEQIQSLCSSAMNDAQSSNINPVEFRILNSFLEQMSSEDAMSSSSAIKSLLGKNCSQEEEIQRQNNESTDNFLGTIKQLDKDKILNIIRRNAFGPDYHNYDAIANCWSNHQNSKETFYNRLLGVYPLAAMINHSCCPNAVRVFGKIPANSLNGGNNLHSIQGDEVMIVHANANIPKGTEITWSYLPPTTPFLERRNALLNKYGFTCQCPRCLKEEDAMTIHSSDSNDLKDEWKSFNEWWEMHSLRQLTPAMDEKTHIAEMVSKLETHLTKSESISNEVQRYCRVGYASLYMEHFNKALCITVGEEAPQMLNLAAQLHFSFASCNNASTEHLSILHLCYNLASLLHRNATSFEPEKATKTLQQIRFWTEQLKKAHMIRYGPLGEDLESVRAAMKHSQIVLRCKDGWLTASDHFI